MVSPGFALPISFRRTRVGFDALDPDVFCRWLMARVAIEVWHYGGPVDRVVVPRPAGVVESVTVLDHMAGGPGTHPAATLDALAGPDCPDRYFVITVHTNQSVAPVAGLPANLPPEVAAMVAGMVRPIQRLAVLVRRNDAGGRSRWWAWGLPYEVDPRTQVPKAAPEWRPAPWRSGGAGPLDASELFAPLRAAVVPPDGAVAAVLGAPPAMARPQVSVKHGVLPDAEATPTSARSLAEAAFRALAPLAIADDAEGPYALRVRGRAYESWCLGPDTGVDRDELLRWICTGQRTQADGVAVIERVRRGNNPPRPSLAITAELGGEVMTCTGPIQRSSPAALVPRVAWSPAYPVPVGGLWLGVLPGGVFVNRGPLAEA
jgi:hypothetical protein